MGHTNIHALQFIRHYFRLDLEVSYYHSRNCYEIPCAVCDIVDVYIHIKGRNVTIPIYN